MEDGAAEKADEGGAEEDDDRPPGDVVGVGGLLVSGLDKVEGFGIDFVFDIVEFSFELFEVGGVDFVVDFVEDVGDEDGLELFF